jgi:hypothetical protein
LSKRYGRIHHITASPNSEKWYFKEVGKEERIKIEYQDTIERFTRIFLLNDQHEMRNMTQKDFSRGKN